jgi:hypothetical protein
MISFSLKNPSLTRGEIKEESNSLGATACHHPFFPALQNVQ